VHLYKVSKNVAVSVLNGPFKGIGRVSDRNVSFTSIHQCYHCRQQGDNLRYWVTAGHTCRHTRSSQTKQRAAGQRHRRQLMLQLGCTDQLHRLRTSISRWAGRPCRHYVRCWWHQRSELQQLRSVRSFTCSPD